jgi:hypothetical protein
VFQTGKFKRASTVYRRMEIEPIPSNEPRLGLFWFIAKGDRRPSRFTSISRPFSRILEVAGFKTLDEGHVDVWPTVQRLDHTLVDYEYDYFPRGRANWRSWFSIQSLIAVHLSLTSCVRGKYPEIDYSC